MISIFAGNNGQIKYRLITRNDAELFRIDPKGKITTLVQFDREKRDIYEFIAVAEDSGSPSLSSAINVKIIVADENDNYPKFEQQIFTFSLLENSYINKHLIAKINVSDSDQGENSKIEYKLASLTGECSLQALTPSNFLFPNKIANLNPAINNFWIDKTSGELNARDTLDREQMNRYCFAVIAMDQGVPSLNSSALLIIDILDQNDNVPKITSNMTVYLQSSLAGSHVTTITAKDLDDKENAELSFRIVQQSDLFKIDERQGFIYLARKLETSDYHTHLLTINVSDNGKPSLFVTGQLRIFIDAATINRGNAQDYLSFMDKLKTVEVNGFGPDTLLFCGILTFIFLIAVIISLFTAVILCRRFQDTSKCNNFIAYFIKFYS